MSRDDRRRADRVRAIPGPASRALPFRTRASHRPARRVGLAGLVGTVVVAVGLGGCSSLFAVSSDSSTSTTGATTASTSPASNGADVAFPVSACATPPAATSASSGGSQQGWSGGAAAVDIHTSAVHTRDTLPTDSTSPATTEPATPTTATPTTVAPATTVPGPGPATTITGGGSRSYTPRTPSSGGSSTPSSPGSGSVSESGHGWVPSVLLAPLPTSLVGLVSFYSDGVHTVLAPAGWTCSIVAGGSSATGLAVYPSNSPNPPATYPVAPGSEGVFAIFTNTGSAVGVGFVCPYFTVANWQKHEGCTTPPPAGQTFTMATPDVASVTDPAGVTGSLEGSGGAHPVTGLVIFPQIQPAVTNGSAVDVAIESCSLVGSNLCPAILSDFSVREFPAPSS